MTQDASDLINALGDELNGLRRQLAETQARLEELQASRPGLAPASEIGRRKMLQRLSRGLVAAGLGATALPVLTTSAAPETPLKGGIAPSPQNSSPKPDITTASSFFQIVLGFEFQPYLLTTAKSLDSNKGLYTSSGAPGSYFCPLALPQGVKISALGFFYIDNDGDTGITFNLTKYNFGLTITASPLVSFTTSGATGQVRVSTQIISPVVTIDNTFNAYILEFNPGVSTTDHVLYGIKITYTNLTAHFEAS